jgi:hypothetical protein
MRPRTRCVQNGVTAYMLNSGRGMEVEAVCERGVITSLNNGETWQLREPRGIEKLTADERDHVLNVSGGNIKDRQKVAVVQNQWDFSPNLEVQHLLH